MSERTRGAPRRAVLSLPARRRRAQEVRSLAPADYTVRVYTAPRYARAARCRGAFETQRARERGRSPSTVAWEGGSLAAGDAEFPQFCVTAAEYKESGENATRRKFFPFK